MSATTPGADALAEVDARAARALTERMDVYADDPATRPHEIAVYHGGTRYIVDPTVPTCDCPDMLHRRPEAGCKHALRVQFERGEREIPAWANRDAIDDPLLDDDGQ